MTACRRDWLHIRVPLSLFLFSASTATDHGIAQHVLHSNYQPSGAVQMSERLSGSL